MRTMFETLSTKNAGIGLRDAVSSITRAAKARLPICRWCGRPSSNLSSIWRGPRLSASNYRLHCRCAPDELIE